MAARVQVNVAGAVLGGLAAVIEPRPDVEVWEWVEQHMEFPPHYQTPYPGRIGFARHTHMVGEWGPFWAAIRYVHSDNVWAAQLGKTTLQFCLVCYYIKCQPGPILVVYPTQNSARKRSQNYLMPLLEHNLADELTGDDDDITTFDYRFRTCRVVIGWAGSPDALAGESIRHAILDEEAKYPTRTEAEAAAKDNALARLTAYLPFADSVGATTPNLEHKEGWKDLVQGTLCRRFVPCPRCAAAGTPFDEEGNRNRGWQVMYFSRDADRKWFDKDGGEWTGGIKWNRDAALTKEERIAGAYYECEDCGAHWTELDRQEVIKRGVWVPMHPEARKYSSHLASWYGPRVTFAMIVGEWFDTFRDPVKRHAFLNNRCAVPFEEEGQAAEESELKKHVLGGHRSGQVPAGTVALLLTADVHDDHVRYRVRAHAADTTSWGVLDGVLPPDLVHLDTLLARSFLMPGGGKGRINGGLIDARWRTDEVYQFCLRHEGLMWACMGHENGKALWWMTKQRVVARPEDGLYLGGDVSVVNLVEGRWKTLLFNRFRVSRGEPGYWYLEQGLDQRFFFEMGGEVKREKKDRRGRPVMEWVQVHDNHALDCEKMQLAAQEVFQIAALAAAPSVDDAADEPAVNPYTGQ